MYILIDVDLLKQTKKKTIFGPQIPRITDSKILEDNGHVRGIVTVSGVFTGGYGGIDPPLTYIL